MRHFWFTDENGDNVLSDFAGSLEEAIRYAEKHTDEYGTIYINEGEEIIDVVIWEDEVL